MIGAHASNAVVVVADCDDCGVDSRPADFGTVGTSSTRWFTVRNNGALTAAMVRDAGLLGGGFAFAGGNYPGTNGSCSNTLAPGSQLPGDGDVHAAGPGQLRRHAGRRLRRRHRHDRDRDARPHRHADEPGAAEGARLVRDRQRRRRLLRPRHDRRLRRPHLHDHQRRRAACDADGGRRRPGQRIQLEGRQLPGDRRHVPGDAVVRRALHGGRPLHAVGQRDPHQPAPHLLLRRREHAVREAGAVRDRD